MTATYAFSVEILRDGDVLATVPASARTCLEDARFHAVLAGSVPNDGRDLPLAAEPVWVAPDLPVVSGVRVTRPGAAAVVYARSVFAPWARLAIVELMRSKRLRAADGVTWRVVARAEPPAPPPRFRSRVERAPYPFRPGVLPRTCGRAGEVVVRVAPAVVDGLRAATLAAGAVECAALLTGQLRHDPERGVALLEVTGQVPVVAGRGGASGSHFAFGPDTFAAARRAHAARGDDSIVAGWFHSHPPCADCPQHPECAKDMLFFSHDDCLVHAAAFPQPYLVALVAGKGGDRPASDPGVALFGWERGAIVGRQLDPAAPAALEAASA